MKVYNAKKNLGVCVYLLSCILLLVGAVVFYQARSTYTDASVYISEMIQHNTLWVATNRYICIFSQLLPFIALQFGASLKTLLVLYSVNFAMIPIVISSILVFRYKNIGGGIAVMMLYFLCNNYLFYYPVSEFQMGLALLLGYHGYFQHYIENIHKKSLLKFLIVSSMILTTVIFSHPLSILACGIWLLTIILNNLKIDKKIIVYVVSIFILAYLTKYFFFPLTGANENYEVDKTKRLLGFHGTIIDTFYNPLTVNFYNYWIKNYFIELGLLVGAFISLIYKKKYILIVVFAVCIFVCWYIVSIAFYDFSYEPYTEHMYQLVLFSMILMFSYTLLTSNMQQRLSNILCFVAFVMCFNKIVHRSNYFQNRIDWLNAYIDEMREHNIKKGILSSNELWSKGFTMEWSVGLETLLLSSINKPLNSVTMVVSQDTSIVNNHSRTMESYNQKYFNIKQNIKYISLDSMHIPEAVKIKGY
jgi:hypothetical protein